MKVVSMVPSWTETLLACGVDVVGRTRFCIHPEEKVRAIPVVGGTKDVSWEKVRALGADLMLLDCEENPKGFADGSPLPFVATHVTSVADLPGEIEKIASAVKSDRLREIGERWRKATVVPAREILHARDLPGVLQWIREPLVREPDASEFGTSSLCYVIWRKPWMCVGRETFIASMFAACGWNVEMRWWSADGVKYPEFEFEKLPANCILLFSSEPYPFHKKVGELAELVSGAAAIVNGESFSWFGLRSLEFLEALKSRKLAP